MSCHKQAGPATFCSFIQDVYDEKITQSDWHAISRLAAAERGLEKLPRTRATAERVEDTALLLADKAAQENGVTIADEDSWAGAQFDSRIQELQDGLASTRNTEGTLAIIEYFAKHGVLDTLAAVRESKSGDGFSEQPREQVMNAGSDDTTCVCGNTVGDSGFYAYSGGREVEPDESWDGDSMFCAACARVFSQSTGDVIDRPARITTLENIDIVAVYDGDGEPPEPPTAGYRVI